MLSRSGSPPMTYSYCSASMTTAVVLLVSTIVVGTGLGRGHLSRQHCEGSRPQTDKLLIKPRRVGQVGVGSLRNGSNERHISKGRPVFSRVTSRCRHQPDESALTGPER